MPVFGVKFSILGPLDLGSLMATKFPTLRFHSLGFATGPYCPPSPEAETGCLRGQPQSRVPRSTPPVFDGDWHGEGRLVPLCLAPSD